MKEVSFSDHPALVGDLGEPVRYGLAPFLLGLHNLMKSKTKITQGKLAKLLEVSRQTVSYYRRRGKTPAVADVEGWKTFLAGRGRVGSASKEWRDKMATEKLAILKEQVHSWRRHNREQDARCMNAVIVRRYIQKLSDFMLAELERSAKELPPLLVGKGELAIYDVCQARIADARPRVLAWAKRQ